MNTLLKEWTVGNSGSSYWTPQPTNINIILIPNGVRITYTPLADSETEIYADIDGAGYVLITTTGLTIGTYDHIVTFTTISYKLRSKFDTTVLSIPSSFAVEEIATGFRLTWIDNNTEADLFEVWANLNGAGYSLFTTVLPGVQVYDYVIGTGSVALKIRAKEGTLPVYSGFTNETVNTVSIPATINDTNTVGWYKPKEAACRTTISGGDSIYWDMKYGKEGELSAEQSSGAIIAYAVYKITACQADFFYAGCQVGDVFPCGTVKTCDANNKVQRFTGNHLTQPDPVKRLVNGASTSAIAFMKTAPFTYNQPEFVYFVGKIVGWSINAFIFDGATINKGRMTMNSTTPNVGLYAGSFSGNNGEMAVGVKKIVRALLAGVNSFLIINNGNPATGTVGVQNMGGFTLKASGANADGANMDFDEIVLRNAADGSPVQTANYNYFARKYSFPTI